MLRWWRRGWNAGPESKDYYTAGFDTQVKRWDKRINIGAGYVEKYMFFPSSNITCLNILYPFVIYLPTLPCKEGLRNANIHYNPVSPLVLIISHAKQKLKGWGFLSPLC
jgi:hypothetical protein